MFNRDAVIEELQKIKALADAGIDGEALAAANLLQARLAKYGLSFTDLSEPEKQTYYIRYFEKYDRLLVAQIAHALGLKLFKVTNYSGRKVKEYGVECSPLDWAEFNTTLEIMRRAWDQEIEVFYTAFVRAQKLYPTNGKVIDITELNPEQRAAAMRMMAMSLNIQRRKVRKALE